MKRRKLVTSMVALGVVAGLLGGGIQSQAADGEKKKVIRWTWSAGRLMSLRKPILKTIRMQTGSLKMSWLRQKII